MEDHCESNMTNLYQFVRCINMMGYGSMKTYLRQHKKNSTKTTCMNQYSPKQSCQSAATKQWYILKE